MAGGWDFDVRGIEQIVGKLDGVRAQLPKAAGAVLFETYEEEVMGPAKEIVPHKEGILENSGFVNPPTIEGDTISVTGGFGGVAGAYAVEQHENLQFQHPNGREAKYLEKPLVAATSKIVREGSAKLKAKLGL